MNDREDRSALHGLEERLFKLVSKKATKVQWAEWLRAPLEHALAEGDKDLALCLLRAGADVGTGRKGCDGRTLLDAAAEGGSEEMVSKVLEAGARAKINARRGAMRMTALHRASQGGHTAVALALLAEGADVGLEDLHERTALHYALQGGHEEVARCLTVAGANLNAADIEGDTPLHAAASEGLSSFVRTLLRRGADVDAVNDQGQSALHLAVIMAHVSSAEALLEAGADVNLRYEGDEVEDKFSPLYLALPDAKMTKVLLEHGADLEGTDVMGLTALHWAAHVGKPSEIDALARAGADIEARSFVITVSDEYVFDGSTPLHIASINWKLENITALLQKGAKVNVIDYDGLTPLHVVCKTSALDPRWAHETADLLLRRGADETITDSDGHTPEDLIESRADTESLHQLLKNAPADRAWRRRGMLVMCRAHLANGPDAVGDGRARKVPCQRPGIGAGAGGSGGGEWCGCVVTRLVGLEADGVFRTIVGFL